MNSQGRFSNRGATLIYRLIICGLRRRAGRFY